MSQAAVQHFINDFTVRQNAPAWLKDQRESALEHFKQLGFPTLRQENWKYTDVRSITSKQFRAAENETNGQVKKIIDDVRFTALDCYELIFVNGHFSTLVNNLPEKIIVKNIDTAITEHPELLLKNIRNNTDKDINGFTALNSAFLNEGAFIHIPDNLVLDKPLCIFYLNTADQHPFVTHPFNLIVLGKNSRATIIESYLGFTDMEYLTNTVTEVVLEDAAHLAHYKIQQEGPNAFHISTTLAQQGKDSQLTSHSISLGGKLVRNDIVSDLSQPGAYIVLNGLYMLNNKQHVDNHTLVNHLQPHTRSEEYYRGVLNGASRGVFNGKVVVHKDAQKSDAHQSNANLLLSDQAEIDTKPELEIYADDVKCSHGATVGQLDEKMLFYLRSRAIDEETARSLLTYAFAKDVINRIEFAPIRERLESIVVGKLPDATLIREFAA